MKKRYAFTAGLLGIVMLFSVAACGESGWYDKDIWYTSGGAMAPTADAVLPTAGDFGTPVYVHDPSVFYDIDSSTYYAFGTHFAVASSSNLIQWTQLASDGDFSKLYGSASFTGVGGRGWPKALENTVTAAGIADMGNDTISTTWAPDVMKIGSRYYMYYSITEKFGSAKSLIGRVSARTPMGPYSGDEIIVQSQGYGGEPNCIDPELFYDKDGKLYMVYGSFYGGIYVKELDENGAPVVKEYGQENYYGTLVAKGDSKGVEGPFIFYNAETDYYYLMVSDGSLSTDYNMRVTRSKSPTGPFTDIAGTDYAVNNDGGVKLAGNYRFRGDANKVGMGHNSVIKADGKYLVVAHVRDALNGGHHVEVHQLFFNKDGWPVLSPDRYVGESAGKVTEAQLAGNYEVVIHSAGTVDTIVNSETYSLTADGKVMKGTEEAGTWSLTDGYFFTVKVNDIEYQGVVAPGWRDYGTKKGVWCMTATSQAGLPIWFNGAD